MPHIVHHKDLDSSSPRSNHNALDTLVFEYYRLHTATKYLSRVMMRMPNLFILNEKILNLWLSIWLVFTRRCCEPGHLITNRRWPTLRRIYGWTNYGVLYKGNAPFHTRKPTFEPCGRSRWTRNAISNGNKIGQKSWNVRRNPKIQKPTHLGYSDYAAHRNLQ